MIEFETFWIVLLAFMTTHILIHEPIHDGIKLMCKSWFPKIHESIIIRGMMRLTSGIVVVIWTTFIVVFALWVIGLFL